MGASQTIYIGPYLEYPPAKERIDATGVLGDESLTTAFWMNGSPKGKGDVYLVNATDFPGCHHLSDEDEDSTEPLDAKEVGRAVVRFRKEFAKEIAALDAAHGTKGEVHFGVVVSWS